MHVAGVAFAHELERPSCRRTPATLPTRTRHRRRAPASRCSPPPDGESPPSRASRCSRVVPCARRGWCRCRGGHSCRSALSPGLSFVHAMSWRRVSSLRREAGDVAVPGNPSRAAREYVLGLVLGDRRRPRVPEACMLPPCVACPTASGDARLYASVISTASTPGSAPVARLASSGSRAGLNARSPPTRQPGGPPRPWCRRGRRRSAGPDRPRARSAPGPPRPSRWPPRRRRGGARGRRG